MQYKCALLFYLFFFALLFPVLLSDQTLYPEAEKRELVPAKVLEVLNTEERIVPGTDTLATYQTLRIRILGGDATGEERTIEDDFLILAEGDSFFLNRLVTTDGTEIFSVEEPDRRPALFFFALLFVTVILFFGRWQGLRSLASLLAGFFIIAYVLLPQLFGGAPPVLTSILCAGVILGVAMYLTHGFNRHTHAAFLGTLITIVITGLLSSIAVAYTKLSGFASEESFYLNLGTQGELNLQGLLLGSIIIGALGILDDVAITQAAAVREFFKTNPRLQPKEVYTKAMQIGREHVGALVNTLVLAYVGASLPLVLLIYNSAEPFSYIINREILSTEIIRTIVGSIGLVLAVPITTRIAVLFYKKGQLGEGHGHTHV
jgi:uncharacterized membrane protein